MKTSTLKPVTRPIRTYDIIALDSEGSGKVGDFTVAVLYDRDGAQVFHDRELLRRHLFRRANCDKLIIAANLEYDYATCFQPFNQAYEVTLVNRKWIRAVRRDDNKHTWTAFDIQRIAPLSVAQMGEIIGLSKLQTPPALVGDPRYHPSEWWCSAHHRLWCTDCYCIRDAEITYKFTVMLQESLNALGAEMKQTTASCAMDLFRRRFLDREIAPTLPERNDLARAAYFGGRVEAFRIGTGRDINVYDFNSLYPSVMTGCEVGDPSTYRRVDRVQHPARYLDRFGQFFGTLRLPDAFVGLLPYRDDGRLYFPTGTVSGSWMLSEVRHAVEHGARILDCKAVVFANSTLRLFDNFVATLYQLRQRYKSDNRPDEVVVKLMMNSLYGKFAQHADTGLQKLVIPPSKYSLTEYEGCTPVNLASREVFLKEVPASLQSPHIHVLWASEITSMARMKLFDALEGRNDELVYCDTDSIHTTGTLPVSADLGSLKLEHDFARATYFAPKEYGGQDKSGEMVQRAKGIPPAYRAQYLRNGSVEFKQPIHTLTAIRRGLRIAEWVNVQKQRRTDAMNRRHETLSDYNKPMKPTYPFDAGELN